MEYDFDAMIDRIKLCKKKAGLTNKQLSELAGVPYGTLNKILGSETREPSINAIIKIAVALGVSAGYLISGDEKSPSPVKDEREAYRMLLEGLSDDELVELKKFTSYLLWKRSHPGEVDA